MNNFRILFQNVSKIDSFLIWSIAIFFISLMLGVLIQRYFVPSLFPQFDLGDGLVILDSVGFNEVAKIKASEIHKFGWQVWELRPQQHSPAGIASIFYALITPVPISMLPFNALINALSAYIVMRIFSSMFSSNASLLAGLVFAANPQTLQWVAAIHRDGIFILGNLLLLQAVSAILNTHSMSRTWRKSASYVLCGVIGTLLVWIARPYFVQVLALFTLVSFLSIIFILIKSFQPYGFNEFFRKSIASSLLLLSITLVQAWVGVSFGFVDSEIPKTQIDASARNLNRSNQEFKSSSGNDSEPTDTKFEREKNMSQQHWRESPLVLDLIERKLYTISIMRNGAVNTGGFTVIDSGVRLDSVGAFVSYLPRALFVGIFSPFPSIWWSEASTPVMTIARKIIGVLTSAFYVCIGFAIIGFLRYRRNSTTLLIFSFSILGILVFTYTYPNIGTLLRFRYCFYMLIVAFGVSTLYDYLTRRYNARLLTQSGNQANAN